MEVDSVQTQSKLDINIRVSILIAYVLVIFGSDLDLKAESESLWGLDMDMLISKPNIYIKSYFEMIVYNNVVIFFTDVVFANNWLLTLQVLYSIFISDKFNIFILLL